MDLEESPRPWEEESQDSGMSLEGSPALADEDFGSQGLTSGETGFRLAGRFAMEDSGMILEESQDSGMILEERRELADENFGNAGVPQQACLAAQLLSTSW